MSQLYASFSWVFCNFVQSYGLHKLIAIYSSKDSQVSVVQWLEELEIKQEQQTIRDYTH